LTIKGPIGRFLRLVLRIWSTPLFGIGMRGEEFDIKFLPSRGGTPASLGIDERIAQIDLARDNLLAGLSAVNELKADAERNKEELRQARQQMEQVRLDKTAAEKELDGIKQIAGSHFEVVKKLIGVPSRTQIAQERFIGFLVGFFASLLASGIWWLCGKLYYHFKG
jgi:hypothetical protein